MNKLLFSAFLGFTCVSGAWAQQRSVAPATTPDPAVRFAATVTAADLRRHLTELASDAYEGRETGQPGQKKAADYLAKQFATLGLRGPVTESKNPYWQSFGLVRTAPNGYASFSIDGRYFDCMRDFFGFGPSVFRTPTPAAPVFLGFGIETDRYNDYANQPDIRGKDVIVLQGEPTDGRDHYLLSGGKQESTWGSGYRKAALARDKGARSVIVVTFAGTAQFESMGAGLKDYLAEPAYSLAKPPVLPLDAKALADTPPEGIGTYITSVDLGLAMLGTTNETLQNYVLSSYSSGKPPVVNFQPQPFTFSIPQTRDELISENVLGLLEGTDKKDEVLVISAHYDHLGIQNDTIYNGADDDGSGTSAVLTLAHAFAKAKAEGHGPRRSILFLLNTGEEKGLLGSQYYTGNPVAPLVRTIADLNIDMVGRNDPHHNNKGDYVYLIGSDRLSPELHALNEAANKRYTRLKLDYKYNAPNDPEQLYTRSDHYNFARQGIPVIFYTSGLHQDYHKATDDVDRIAFDKLEQRTRLVFHTAWELANRDQRPAVVVK
ncbi:Zn-dependent amino- or carboxypeptidase, M28 family [Hymenobacter gelipurpurascens]|uniref:Zn-dependent amino- or carboxypeptidase, M28 family n=1 Tax=Hymenobacter gelipurpurascens TaxID=89968 RepID=A0A212UGL7_9BACT|nr:M28 family peptidase [Hymenobacter gelipurpurascens]SNC77385.1 Zn-dependent amino- or carboxypeptidase, M28 family [Hymenobacter gelipurpurascens]